MPFRNIQTLSSAGMETALRMPSAPMPKSGSSRTGLPQQDKISRVSTADMPKVYSYAVARDFGFAPNPFYGWCTLATCKPVIRRVARVGDFILGTGSKQLDREGFVIYAMRVTEALTFNEYWSDKRFQTRKPDLSGS